MFDKKKPMSAHDAMLFNAQRIVANGGPEPEWAVKYGGINALIKTGDLARTNRLRNEDVEKLSKQGLMDMRLLLNNKEFGDHVKIPKELIKGSSIFGSSRTGYQFLSVDGKSISHNVNGMVHDNDKRVLMYISDAIKRDSNLSKFLNSDRGQKVKAQLSDLQKILT